MKNALSFGFLWLLGIVVIYFYYIGYPVHGESKDVFFFLYLFLIAIIYGIFKFLQVLSGTDRVIIKPIHLIYGFLIQYLLVCIYFFVLSGDQIGLGLILFFKSAMYLFTTSLIWINFYCFGKKLLSLNNQLEISDTNVKNLVSIALGFISSMLLIFLAASLGYYNLIIILCILGFTTLISYPQWKDLIINFFSHRITYVNDRGNLLGSTKLMIDEGLYLLISFLLSVNFVSVFRPFPIGWDDLGAYMNYPKLLSAAGEHIAIGKMYLWELYTGIGFLAGSQTFAFYLNSFAGMIAVISIYLSISALTNYTKQKYNLGLLSASIFLMMPMVVFQIAKDMKIDVGLFSISIIALSLLYYLLFTQKSAKYLLYGVLGIIIGTAFAIKITSLLLLLGVIGAIFFYRLQLIGFISFLLMFIGVFSIMNLWGVINVVVPGNTEALQLFGFASIVSGISLFIYSVIKEQYSKNINEFITQIVSILLGFFLILCPWIIKNIMEIPSDGNASISTFISGIPDKFEINYLEIHSQEEINKIRENKASGISTTGTTSNEDWGRYFGYEKGINNFLKLPWNLTFQTNQKGEFTDITFIFLALLPGIFLFLPFRKELYKSPLIGLFILVLLYYIPSPISSLLTNLFSLIQLPIGYAVIAGLFLLPITYLHWALDKTDKFNKIFLLNLAFLTVYMGLWAISSYGVVWYGIVMYYVFIVIVILSILSRKENSDEQSYLSYTVLCFVIIYAFQSAIPHGVTNISAASYKDYKLGGINEEVSLMTYHPEYFSILFEINISDTAKQDLFIDYRKRLLTAISSTQDFEKVLPQIQSFSTMRDLHKLIVELSRVDFPGQNIDSDIKDIRQDLYEKIIYAPKEIKNEKKIYRAGTFLKYFISDNNTRLLEDGLLETFNDYFYSEDSEITLNRFKKLGIEYILIDLNAATIDQDPAKNLTKRYENMLDFVKDKRVELVETDSICLLLALDNYAQENNYETYMGLASVNHSSEYSQTQKRQACFTVIQKIISSDEALKVYPYLNAYKNALLSAEVDINDVETTLGALSQIIKGNGYKALFKLN